ncbi:MAG: glycoside hydrolase family 3 C-terminal domain-containing protein [Acidobacteriota bacterium]|jgi:beta-glucosidase|nr:glycoside hydrolase family 3 C-terminal domain-containing protein [Acidobacteriota bacterium]
MPTITPALPKTTGKGATRFATPVLCLCAALLCLGGCARQEAPEKPRESKLMRNEARIDEIVAGMSLEEKIAMLHGKHMFTSEGVPRLGIPEMVYSDGPFGIREEMEPDSWNPLGLENDAATFFPTGSALAATWSYDAAYAYGTGMAREARLRGKDMLLGPAINIQRLPTGGRTYEYLSEDPFLSSRLSVGYTLGAQDNGIAVCVKHYALNNQEQNRGTVNVVVSPRAMREVYLKPFEAAVVEGGAYGVMAAYNKVNGRWCSENDILQNKILRDEWGFKGLVVSDWGGTHNTVDAALYGLDVEMPGGRLFGEPLLEAVKAGKVPVEVIDQKVRNILRVRLAVEPVPPEQANKALTAKPEQARIAYDVAAKSIVLLKNEGVGGAGALLPLDLAKYKKIAVVGDNAVRAMASGGVGAGVKAHKEVTPLEGLKDRVGDKAEIVFAEGYRGFTREERSNWGNPYRDADPKLLAEAVRAAKEADVVLFVAGDNREVETEGSDRDAITLPSGQDQVLEALAKANPNIVTVLVTGGPLDLRRARPLSPAILVSWFNGSEGGNALADVLLGKVSPSGKLPFTFPAKLEDSPAYALGSYKPAPKMTPDVFRELVRSGKFAPPDPDDPSNVAEYSEDLLVGYRWFDTKNIEPLYPFGHGLSYATFDYADIATGKGEYKEGDVIEVTFDLANRGESEADEVAQLYVSRVGAKTEWPAKELKAFQRVNLKAGERKRVTLAVPVAQLRHWDEARHKWALEGGVIDIAVGSSSRDIRLTKRVAVK